MSSPKKLKTIDLEMNKNKKIELEIPSSLSNKTEQKKLQFIEDDLSISSDSPKGREMKELIKKKGARTSTCLEEKGNVMLIKIANIIQTLKITKLSYCVFF